MTNLNNVHNIETAMLVSAQRPSRIIRLKQVIALTGLSRSTIYERMNPKSRRYDATFPKAIKLSSSTLQSGAIGWEERAIERWIENRIQSCLVAD